jgi:methionyl-tRNA synthetase
LKKFNWSDTGSADLLPPGHALGVASLLFEKIENPVIEAQIQKLMNTKAPDPSAAVAAKPLKPECTIDDFGKLDIRVGKVTAAEKMEKSNKLLKLTVNSGLDTRTILSGIAQYYTPEEMVGKNVVFIANLAPRKMMGLESQGMILTASDKDGNVKLLQPAGDVDPGATIS